jgi:charged multivesicular body protein 4
LEGQLKQVDETLLTLHSQRENLENTSTNAEVLSTLKTAASSLKNANKNMDVEKVHDLMDELNEQLDISNELSSAITALNPGIDESELESELKKLEQEEFDKNMVKIPKPTTVPLPDVPEHDLVKDKPKGENPCYPLEFSPDF